MICIFDVRNSKRGEELREMFLNSYLPCALKEYEKISDSLVNIFFSDSAYLFEYKMKKLDPETVVIVNVRAAIYELEKSAILNRVTDILFVKYGITPMSYTYKRFSQIGNKTLYVGRFLLLTYTENLILRHISVCKGKWCTAKEIAAYCLPQSNDKHTVAVHVASIVEKSLRISLIPIIVSKRNYGYKIYDDTLT
ncbi:MAG: hypothetical protein IKM46_04500 [Clostridia bacterium]|nr:hypothetical protein [Clostridia bacterium]